MPRSKLSGSELQLFDVVSGSESTLTKIKSTALNTLNLEGNTNTDRVRITNVAQPTQASDVTTKDYVEGELATLVNDLVVTENQIQDDAVTETKIADASVTTDKIGTLTALTVDGPIVATSFITDGDAGGSVSGGSSTSAFHPILLMAKTLNQTLPNHQTSTVTFDSVTHQSTDNVITYNATNSNFVLANVGVYEVSFSVIFQGDTDAANRRVHFECSDSPTKHYAYHSDHQAAGGHDNIRFTTIDFVKVSTINSTITVYAYQSNADGSTSQFLSGSADNLNTRICIRQVA